MNLTEYEEEIERILRFRPLSDWYKWAIENLSAEEIAQQIDVSEKTIYRTYEKISHLLVGIRGLSLRNIRNTLQRKKAIELLKEKKEPQLIMEEVFKLNPKHDNDVAKFYERLFGFEMTFKQILEKYYLKK